MRRCICLFAITALSLTASEVQARGFGAARGGARVAAGPYGGVHAGAARGGTYVGPRGTTVQAGRVGGVTRGPLGGVHAGGAEAARVTTPGGRTVTTGSRGGATVGPYGGVTAHRAGGTVARGPYGSTAIGTRGGVAVGPYGGVAAGRGGLAVGPYGGVAHSTRYVGRSSLYSAGSYVRGGVYGRGYSYFNPAWYGVHTGAWTTTRWRVANYWAPPVWDSLALWCGSGTQAYDYDYGTNIVIDNDNVYVGGQSAGTVEQYAQYATDLADAGRKARPADDDEWQGLGVFGMIQGDGEKTAQHVFQLAINKAGVVRGNYYDAVADNTLPVYGSLDKKTQKLAWSIGDKKTIVFEAGLSNLTRSEATVLVHYGKERTQQMILVRLEQDKEAKK